MSTFPPPQLQRQLDLVKSQKKQQQSKFLWRTWLTIGGTIGLGFASTSNYWNIENSSQINIEGATFVSETTILQALDFKFPQTIWKTDTRDLAAQIQAISSIDSAEIHRQITPVQLNIFLQEKIPVAIATFNSEVGFIDAQGEWIPHKFYDNLTDNNSLPKIKVTDYQLKFQVIWKPLYQLIQTYPELEISEVYWNASDSLFIQSKIGQIMLGNNIEHLTQQFKTMLQLKNLNQHIDSSKIAYIDLSNPGVNLIQKY